MMANPALMYGGMPPGFGAMMGGAAGMMGGMDPTAMANMMGGGAAGEETPSERSIFS